MNIEVWKTNGQGKIKISVHLKPEKIGQKEENIL